MIATLTESKRLPYVFGPEDRSFLAYLQARLRVRLTRKLRRAEYERLLGMNIDQIAHALSEGSYGEEARSLGAELAGGRLVRAMIRNRLQTEVRQLRHMARECPPAMDWIVCYSWKYDLSRLRGALRGRRVGADLLDGVLSPLLNLPWDVYREVAHGNPLDESSPAFAAVKGSPFADTVALALSPQPPAEDGIEVALLHGYYNNCLAPMMASTPPDSPAREVLENEVHVLNLLTMLSSSTLNASVEETLIQIIPHGAWADEERVRALLASSTAGQLARALRREKGLGILARLPVTATDDLTAGDVERAARRALAQLTWRAGRITPATPAGLIAYITALELEARNLAAGVSGILGEIPPPEVRTMLVLGS